MTQTLSMSALFKKLSLLGFSKKYVRTTGLPSWWDKELDENPVAVLEGAGYIATRLHLELSSLLAEDQSVDFKPLPHTEFKYRNQQTSDTPFIATQLASRVAEIVSYGISTSFVPLPDNVNKVRSEILATHSSINLQNILDYCWEHGIAVIYFNDYPQEKRKITGIIQWHSGHPVIVLSHKSQQPAYLAFHLAHELGHLALGHLTKGILVDEEITSKSEDIEEKESNNFAVKLLVNNFDNCFENELFCIHNYKQLINKINKRLQLDSTVDPCAIAFNYAWHTGKYGIAKKAVNHLNPSDNGQEIINQFLENHLDWDCLNEDNYDYLEHILGE